MNDDLISRKALKKVITANHYLLSAKHNSTDYGMFTTGIIDAIDNAPTVEITEEQAIDKLHETGWLPKHDKEMTERPHEWIPVKWHFITDEERTREGYPEEWKYILDCKMPEDGEAILVQTHGGYIREDEAVNDDGWGLDSGYDWIEDIIAWMPFPEPYKEEEENER